MDYTHNQIKNLLSRIATNHNQINDFGFGDTWEQGVKALSFPILWATLNPGSINDNEVVLNYSLYFLDLVNRDEANEDEVLSDQLQTAVDVYSILRSDIYQDKFLMDG